VAFQRQSSFTCVQTEKRNFIFLKEENDVLATTFKDEVFLAQLAYLCDIFAKLNKSHSKEKIFSFCNSMTKSQPLKENYSCGKLIC